MELVLDSHDRNALCAVARNSVNASLQNKASERPHAPGSISSKHPALSLRGHGAFVTLHENGQLRGCIGRMRSDEELSELVAGMACAAAFEDPRFPPLVAEELDSVEFEITVLGPMERMHDPSEVLIGTHGLYISHRGRAGVLLPQVATEQGWDRWEFLDRVCWKAGLPEGSWKAPGAEVYLFEGLVFGESPDRDS
jgi:AmmeMemoRadiSam system protein A